MFAKDQLRYAVESDGGVLAEELRPIPHETLCDIGVVSRPSLMVNDAIGFPARWAIMWPKLVALRTPKSHGAKFVKSFECGFDE
jgi:hypothetical protein